MRILQSQSFRNLSPAQKKELAGFIYLDNGSVQTFDIGEEADYQAATEEYLAKLKGEGEVEYEAPPNEAEYIASIDPAVVTVGAEACCLETTSTSGETESRAIEYHIPNFFATKENEYLDALESIDKTLKTILSILQKAKPKRAAKRKKISRAAKIS